MLLKKWPIAKIGARILKTGIAIVVSMYLASIFELSTTLAAIGATLAVQQSIYRSYLSLVEQFKANLIGACIAICIVFTSGANPIMIGVGSILTLWITSKTKNENQIGVALVTLIVIMESHTGNFILFALQRFSTIMLGVLSAFMVNVFLFPPKYDKKLFVKLKEYSNEILDLLLIRIQAEIKPKLHKRDLDQIRKKLVTIEYLYQLLKDEQKFYKTREINKARKLVVYRGMISTAKRANSVLRNFHNHEKDLKLLPLDFQNKTLKQLEILISHHRNIYTNFLGNSTTERVFETTSLSELLSLLGELKVMEHQDDLYILRTMVLVSTMFEYGEHIQHLQGLCNSFHQYHEDGSFINKSDLHQTNHPE